MNKKFLLAGVATALFATNANAYNLNLDITPYVSAKMAYAKLKNKSDVDSTFYLPGTRYADNVVSDKTLKDDVWGTRLAYGLSAPVKFGKIRTELELGWNSKAGDDNLYDFVLDNHYRGEHYQVNTSVWTGMFNVYYDIDTGTKLMPYINAGVGYAHLKTKAHTWGMRGPFSNGNGTVPYDLSFKEDANNFAWNIGLGVSYALTDNLSVDLGYRYTDFGNIRSNPIIRDSKGAVMGADGPFIFDGDMKLYMHEVNLGLRYAF